MVVMLLHSKQLQSRLLDYGSTASKPKSKKRAVGSWSGPGAGHISRGKCNQICSMYVVRRSLEG